MGYILPKPEFELLAHRLGLYGPSVSSPRGLFPLRPRRTTGHHGYAAFPLTPLSRVV